MSTPTTKLAIAINWPHLRDKMKEYLDERREGDGDERTLRAIALSDFLVWLNNQQRQQQRREVDDK